MSIPSDISQKSIDDLHIHLKKEAETARYFLNPDVEFAKDLVNSLLINEKRYGYRVCPCRLAAGIKTEDLDIICPCDYRDADITEFGGCFCALYVSKNVIDKKQETHSIPERRPPSRGQRAQFQQIKNQPAMSLSSLSKPVWRCKVCGYLCARDSPPEVCPICKAKKDRFERFI
ncbi:MAG: ferredoxin:glutaredoxin reductase [Euryarchaeota archaeon]|nr:ferredoxin:glutaredoxin reductase [Euryarchaeota archaeon]